MATLGRSLLLATTLGATTWAQILGIPPAGQITSLRSSPLPVVSDVPTVTPGSDAGLESPLLSAPLTTLVTSISAAGISEEPEGAAVSVGAQISVGAQASAGPVPAKPSPTYDTVTRYILPAPISIDSSTSLVYDSVTRYILPPHSGSSVGPESVTNLESFPWILPDSTTSAVIQSVTNLESFPWILPDPTTSASAQSITDLESFPWILPDSTTTSIIPVTNLETFPTFVPDPVVSTTVQSLLQPIVTSRSGTIQTVTNLEVFPSIIPDSVTLYPVLTPSSIATGSAVSSLRSIVSVSPIAIAISTASGSARFSAPTLNPLSGLPSLTASTISIAALTPVGLPPAAVSTTAGAPSNGTSCQLSKPQCPACNGATVLDNQGSSWQVYCDSMVLTSKNYMRTGNSTAADCLAACNDFPGCGAVSISRTNYCLLGAGTSYYLSAQKGEIGFLKLLRASVVSPSAYVNTRTVRVSFRTPTTLSTRPSTSPSSARSTSARALPSQQPNQPGCTLTDINCPRCNLVNITNSYGAVFRILCNSFLISTEATDFNTTKLDECLTNCNDSSCVGVSYNNGLCHIARTRIIGSVATDGSFAFIPLRAGISNVSSQSVGSGLLSSTLGVSRNSVSLFSTAPQLLTPSSFPTGDFTIETWRTWSGSAVQSTGLSVPSLDSSVGSPTLDPTLPLTLTTVTDKASWTTRRASTATALALSSRSASASAIAPAVTCPAANGQKYAPGDIRLPFTIFCDVAVYSQPYSIFPVSSLQQCARNCGVGCSAFEYVNDICQLFDGLYDVISVPGAIVGYLLGAAGPEIFTVPGPVVASLPPVSNLPQATVSLAGPLKG